MGICKKVLITYAFLIVPVSDSKNVLFNAMTKKFFYISKHNTAACLFMLNNIESFLSDEAKGFVEKLYDNGFVIDDDRDELSELKSLFYEYKNNKVLNLRCAKEQKENLQRAIVSLQTKASSMMRDNPNLTPTQAAILIALDSESTLQGYLNDKTPFENEALKLITKMKTSLQRANND